MSFFKKLVKVVATPVTAPIKLSVKVSATAGKAVGKLPVVGKPLKTVINLANAPMKLADSIASGNRLDKAVIDNIKSQVHDVKEVAPYAQMVISVVPGVGTVASGAIGAGVALASGQPIDKAIVEGVKDALPGGPAAKAAFDMATATMQGKPLAAVALSAIPGLNQAQKQALQSTLKFAADIAAGKKVTEAALKAAEANLPPDIRKAASVGLAIAKGQSVQHAMLKAVTPDVLNKLSDAGMTAIKKNQTLTAGFGLVKNLDQQKGFKVAQGLLLYQATPAEITSVRDRLNVEQKKGFDIAASAHVGMATVKQPDVIKGVPANSAAEAKARFAMAATSGMQGGSPAMKQVVLSMATSDPAAKAGTTVAVEQIAAKKKNQGWWHQLLVKLRLAND